MSGFAATPLDVFSLLRGRRIVVVGATGFLGKIFWSMLLDRFPDIGRLYLLLRPKGESADVRFWREVATSDALAPLRTAHGDAFSEFLHDKVEPIAGDMGAPRCGVEDARVRDLSGTVDAVVNVAGVVDFNPPLDEALAANAFGAQNLVTFARALGGARILHTSTCYVAGRRAGPIHEEDPRGYPFPRAAELGANLWDPDREIAECLDLVAQANHRSCDAFRQSEFGERARKNLIERGEPAHGAAHARELERVKRKFVRDRLVEAGLDRATHWGWENIYTYTKAIGEQVIAGSGLPFTIARPACCESTVAFPFRGYNEGVNTSAPLIYLMMKGQQQILARHVPLDFIPADYVVAGMILALAELLEGTAKPVYQFGASDINPCTAQRFGELVGLFKRKHYQQKGSGHPLLDALQARFEPTFVDRARFERLGPPAIAGAAREVATVLARAKSALPALGPAARALEAFARREEKIAEIQTLFEPFAARLNGPFDCSNTRAAFARLSAEDRVKLPWAPEAIDWADWMMNVHMPALEQRILPQMDRKLKKELQPLAAHETLVTLLDEMAERFDLGTALQDMHPDGLTRASFREVRARSIAMAAHLAALGVVKGDRVALSARNQSAWAVAYFGIVRAGATAVPLDPGIDQHTWSSVLAESGARAIVWDSSVKARAGAFAHPAGLARIDLHDGAAEGDALVPPEVAVEPGDVASLIYTSGTSGRPKGVMLTHANFTALVAALAPIFPLSRGDRLLSLLPLHHTFEFTCGLLLPMSRGARVVYVGELTGERFAEGLSAIRPTAIVGVPAIWQVLERRILEEVDARGPLARAAFDAAGDLNRWLISHLGLDVGRVLFGPVHRQMGGRIRWLISGGAALSTETRDRFAALGIPLTEGYGLTEAAPLLTVVRRARPTLGRAARAGDGVGQPIPGVEVTIANPDAHGVGEVIARGPNVMAGYTDPEATRQAIGEGGWLHTGDLGRMGRGNRLEIVGRIKDVVMAPTGENVYPDDVERRLGTVANIVELTVVGVEVRGSERLACLAVPAAWEGETAGHERARASLHRAIDELPTGQRPAILHLYDAPLPRTSTLKVKRDEVRAILGRLIAASASLDMRAAGAAAGPVRHAIAVVRGIPVHEVTAQASLGGELGFDSLMLTELLEVLEARFGAIDRQRLQGCGTVAEVEALVAGLGAREARDAAGEASGAATPGRPEQEEGASVVLPQAVQQAGKSLLGKLQDVFYSDVMKPRVTGRAYIPYDRTVIVVANHASHLDMGLVRHALGTYGRDIVSLAAQDYFFESGIKRAFFENLTNLKAIDRKASLRQTIRQASEVIESGKTVLVFPEGTRSSTGEIHEFKPLVGYLALVHGVDILPLYLGGTQAAMPKGAPLPRRRDLLARIGPPLRARDLQRLTAGLSPADAARDVARIAREAVLALQGGQVLDLARTSSKEDLSPEREHPLVKLFGELEGKFRAGELEKPVSYYVTLGSDELAKWTVRVDGRACEVRPGKPEGGQADCVLKTSPEIFAKIVRESYVPSTADFLSGAIKSNDMGLLVTFQRVFQLDQAS
jgi:long-chain acyl-CoA synthetase